MIVDWFILEPIAPSGTDEDVDFTDEEEDQEPTDDGKDPDYIPKRNNTPGGV